MSDCCSSSCAATKPGIKHSCPVNQKKYSAVSLKTLLYHINEPWKLKNTDQSYYFCDDPDCDVVYFGQDNSIIEKSALRTIVGIKEKSNDALVCYCFGISINEAAVNPEIKTFVMQKTKEKTCACEICNPSGRCCLKDFPSRVFKIPRTI